MAQTSVFIHSSAHSGSTWIGYVLGSNADSAFVGELYRAWHDTDRVPCTVCAARGLPACAVLSGIEHAPPEQAFQTIAARAGKRVIVDNSKKAEFTARFTEQRAQDVRLIHVLKDPRGWFASVRRRNASDIEWCLNKWHEDNSAIAALMRASGRPYTVAMYDLLARRPLDEFRALADFCGLPFQASAMEYWKTEHHGFAANGASAAILRHANFASPPSHFSTADDRFYNEVWSKSFVDERWKDELSEAEAAKIVAHERVRALLRRFGYRLTRDGVERASRPVLRAAFATASSHVRALGRRIRGA